MARSSTISRVRWATVIRKVFWMMKAPTRTATAAKASRAVLMKPIAVVIWSSVSLVCWFPVTASSPAGMVAPTAVASCVRSTPVRGGDADPAELAGHPEEPLRLLEVEGGERRAGQVVGRAEAHDADDGEGLLAGLEGDVDRVADGELLRLGGSGIDHHLSWCARSTAVAGLDAGGTHGGLIAPAGADGRRSLTADRLAVAGQELGEAVGRGNGAVDAGDLRHALQDGLVERSGRGPQCPFLKSPARMSEVGCTSHLRAPDWGTRESWRNGARDVRA